MKLLSSLLFISLFFMNLAVCAQEEPVEKTLQAADADVKPGRLTVDKEILDFGIIEPESRITGEFVLTNTGEGPVEIIGKPGHSCGCTVPDLAKSVLQPGESTTMKVVYTAGKLPGKSSKKIWLDVKEPSQPRKLTVHIQSEVRKNIEALPEKYEFEIRETAANRVPIVLESVGAETFKITGYAVSGNAAEVIFDATKEAAKHELPIKVDLDKLRGVPMGSITVNTTHPKSPMVVIPFKVVMPFSAEPPRKFFRDIVPGKDEKANVVIISNYGEPFELGEIRSEKGLIKELSRKQVEGGYDLEVVFTTPDDKSMRLAKDTLIVTIKDRPEEKIEVLFYGRTK